MSTNSIFSPSDLSDMAKTLNSLTASTAIKGTLSPHMTNNNKNINNNNTREACYICGYQPANPKKLLRCHYRKFPEYPTVPFYDILQILPPAVGAAPINKVTCSVNACTLCVRILYHQWLEHEAKNVPILKRMYWMKRGPGVEMKQLAGNSQVEMDVYFQNGNKDQKVELPKLSSCSGSNTQITGKKRATTDQQDPIASKSLKIESEEENDNDCIIVDPAPVSDKKDMSSLLNKLTTSLSQQQQQQQQQQLPQNNCYLCGLKNDNNNRLIIIRDSLKRYKTNFDENIPIFWGLNKMNHHQKGSILENGTSVICKICYVQNQNRLTVPFERLHVAENGTQLVNWLQSRNSSVSSSRHCSGNEASGSAKKINNDKSYENDILKQISNLFANQIRPESTNCPKSDQSVRSLSASEFSAVLPQTPSSSTKELPTPLSSTLVSPEPKPDTKKNPVQPVQPETNICVICENSASCNFQVRTQVPSELKNVLETDWSEPLFFEKYSFFPILLSLSGNKNLANICQICYHNLKIQWENQEKTCIENIKKLGKKYGKKERWLRSYNVSEADCAACGCSFDICELKAKKVFENFVVPKIFLKGLYFDNYVVLCKKCDQDCIVVEWKSGPSKSGATNSKLVKRVQKLLEDSEFVEVIAKNHDSKMAQLVKEIKANLSYYA